MKSLKNARFTPSDIDNGISFAHNGLHKKVALIESDNAC